MFDTGTSKETSEYYDAAGRVVLPFLRSRGITQLDGIFISHEDTDHSGGLYAFLGKLGVKNIYLSNAALDRLDLYNLLQRYESAGTHVEILAENSRVTGADYTFSVLSAPEGQGNAGSLMVLLTAYNRRVLFCGDALPAHWENENILRNIPRSDIATAPHHGLASGYVQGFFGVNPTNVIVSGSLPLGEFYASWPGMVYNTYEQGAVTVKIGREDYTIYGYRKDS